MSLGKLLIILQYLKIIKNDTLYFMVTNFGVNFLNMNHARKKGVKIICASFEWICNVTIKNSLQKYNLQNSILLLIRGSCSISPKRF